MCTDHSSHQPPGAHILSLALLVSSTSNLLRIRHSFFGLLCTCSLLFCFNLWIANCAGRPLPRMSAHGKTKGPTAAPTGSSAPSTPQRLQNGAEIDKLVDSINKKWNLGIQLRGKGYSPSKSSPNDLRNKIYGRIQYLFYKNEPALELATDNFNLRASALECEDRLKLLYKLLSNASNMDEPPSRDSTQNIGRPRRLASSFRG